MCRVRPSPERPLRRWVPAVAWLCLAPAMLLRPAAAQTEFEPDDYYHSTWARLEYLNFWVQKAPLSTPLVTAGNAAGMGRLGSLGTDVLLGGSFRTPLSPGARFTFGGWIGDDEVLGGEFSIFAVALRAAHFSAASNALGSPLLAVPFADVTSGTPVESSLLISQPGVQSGHVWGDDALEFGGAALDGLGNLSDYLPGAHGTLAAIGGVRFLELRERFKFSSGSTTLAGVSTSHNDIFMSQDSFVGPEFGLRGGWRMRRFTIEATGKAAIGGTFATQYVSGQEGLTFAYPRVNLLKHEGLFAQTSNGGWRYLRSFSVVPAVQLRAGYDVSKHVRLTIGYEAFLWTRMVRPTSQIDRQINLSQIGGPLTGVARPAPQSNRTNFWAQGFTVGVQVGY